MAATEGGRFNRMGHPNRSTPQCHESFAIDASLYSDDAREQSLNTRLRVAEALILLAFSASWARSQCAGVPIEVNDYMVVPVEVSGHPVRLALDPIRNVLLDSAWVARTGIETVDSAAAGFGPHARVGGGGPKEYEPRFAVDLQLNVDDLSIHLPPVIVLDVRGPLGASFEGIGGLLGTDLFRGQILSIDPIRKCMNLGPRESAAVPGGEPLEVIRERNRPTVEGKITLPGGEQLPARFLVDFGMSGPVRLSTRFVDQHHLVDRLETSVPEHHETGLGGDLSSLKAGVAAISIGDTTWNDVEVTLARETSGTDADPPWDALIGVGLLKTRKIVYDPAGDRLWLLPATGSPARP